MWVADLAQRVREGGGRDGLVTSYLFYLGFNLTQINFAYLFINTYIIELFDIIKCSNFYTLL